MQFSHRRLGTNGHPHLRYDLCRWPPELDGIGNLLCKLSFIDGLFHLNPRIHQRQHRKCDGIMQCHYRRDLHFWKPRVHSACGFGLQLAQLWSELLFLDPNEPPGFGRQGLDQHLAHECGMVSMAWWLSNGVDESWRRFLGWVFEFTSL